MVGFPFICKLGKFFRNLEVVSSLIATIYLASCYTIIGGCGAGVVVRIIHCKARSSFSSCSCHTAILSENFYLAPAEVSFDTCYNQ